MSSAGSSRRGGRRGTTLTTQHLLHAGSTEHYEDTALYDFEYEDQRADIDWYLALFSMHARVRAKAERPPLSALELGAGTGRITLPLIDAGHQLTALDISEKMLAALKAKAKAAALDPPACIVADMRKLPLDDSSVDLVIAPFNCLMHLYTWKDLLVCFREAARVLRPGGEFAFDVLLPDLDWLTWDPTARHGVTKFKHPVTGQRMVYSTNHDYDHGTQVCHIRLYYDLGSRPRPRSEPHKLVHLAHRQIFPEEIRALVELSGLELVSFDGDFLGRSLNEGIESQVVRSRKPA